MDEVVDTNWQDNLLARAKVWRFFQINENKNRARCKECGKVFMHQASGSTTAKRHHLKRFHGFELPKLCELSESEKLYQAGDN